MSSEKWDRQIFRLPANHGWTAKPGNKVVVADRGALRFEIPNDWIVEPGKNSIKLIDGEPPDDDMSLEVSVIYVGARGYRVDWSGMPLSQVIKDVTSERAMGQPAGEKARSAKGRSTRQALLAIKLGELEMAWVQTEFIDKVEKRPAFSRMLVTRHAEQSIHALFTLSFWPEDSERATRCGTTYWVR